MRMSCVYNKTFIVNNIYISSTFALTYFTRYKYVKAKVLFDVSNHTCRRHVITTMHELI